MHYVGKKYQTSYVTAIGLRDANLLKRLTRPYLTTAWPSAKIACELADASLRAQYMALASSYRSAVGRKWLSLLEKAYVIYIMPGETVSVQDFITQTEANSELVTY